MLALKAKIETAWAGEGLSMGDGEVRTLATHTPRATDQISAHRFLLSGRFAPSYQRIFMRSPKRSPTLITPPAPLVAADQERSADAADISRSPALEQSWASHQI